MNGIPETRVFAYLAPGGSDDLILSWMDHHAPLFDALFWVTDRRGASDLAAKREALIVRPLGSDHVDTVHAHAKAYGWNNWYCFLSVYERWNRKINLPQDIAQSARRAGRVYTWSHLQSGEETPPLPADLASIKSAVEWTPRLVRCDMRIGAAGLIDEPDCPHYYGVPTYISLCLPPITP